MSDNSKGKRKETEDSKREQEIKKWEDILKSTNFQDVLDALRKMLVGKLKTGGFTLELIARPDYDVASASTSQETVAIYHWHKVTEHAVTSNNGNDNIVRDQAETAVLEDVTDSELHNMDDHEFSPSVLKSLKLSVPSAVKTWKELEDFINENNGSMFIKELDLPARLRELRVHLVRTAQAAERVPDTAPVVPDTQSTDELTSRYLSGDHTAVSTHSSRDEGPSSREYRGTEAHDGENPDTFNQAEASPIPGPSTSPAGLHTLGHGRGGSQAQRGRGSGNPLLASLERSGLLAEAVRLRQSRSHQGHG